jgi:Mu transposase, C-terminal domain
MFSATSARTRLTHSPLYPRCQRITMSGLTIASASRMNTVRIALRLLGARVHGTTGEVPIERFQRAKANALKSVAGIPPFHVACELIGRVQADCAVEIDGNAYSVPWRLIGETVRATLMDGVCPHPPWQPRGGGPFGLCRPTAACRRPAHFEGLAGFRSIRARPGDPPPSANLPPALLRSHGEYEALLGWLLMQIVPDRLTEMLTPTEADGCSRSA